MSDFSAPLRARLTRLMQVTRWGTPYRLTLWSLLLISLALLLASPIFAVVSSLLQPFGESWAHLQRTVLRDYIINSLLLMLGVGVGVTLLGVCSAWLTVMCRFPGRRLWQWALLLPLAIPAYILAYAYTDALQQVFVGVRSRAMAVVVLSLALYPYTYLMARNAFAEQASSLLEASRCLGLNAWQSFWRVSLPLARPGIVAGVSLALMETLSDYGTVDYFGISTFTTGIYRTWFGLGEKVTATQLSALLLVFVLLLFGLEQASRRRSRHQRQPLSSRYGQLLHYPLQGWRAWLACLSCALPVVLGFVFPMGILATMAWQAGNGLEASWWLYARHSLQLASSSALLAIVIALLIAYALRLQPHPIHRLLRHIATLGYAVPGSVIAVGIMLSLAWLHHHAPESIFGNRLIIGSLAGLVFAYLSRFLAVALGGIEAGLARITSSMERAAKSLGHRELSILWRVHIPLLRSSLLSAGLLVFVDVMKELPATLIIRPFNFDTLAVRVYRLASDERLHEAASGALTIAIVGVIPVLLLAGSLLHGQRRPSS